MREDSDGLPGIVSAHCYFDKVTLRTAHALAPEDMRFLGENADAADFRKGHPIRNSSADFILTVVKPNTKAMAFLADEAQQHCLINYVEVALDVIASDESRLRELRELFDRHFVQGWHGKRETVVFENGTYTGQRRPGHKFAWYSDRHSKLTGEVHCLHVEGRHQGVDSVRKLGINCAGDMLAFDHQAYWEKRLKLMAVCVDRLGRFHSNRISKERRHHPKITECGNFHYNEDRRMGSVLFRVHSEHYNQEVRSVQRFVDRYGRGPFLVELDVSAVFGRMMEEMQ